MTKSAPFQIWVKGYRGENVAVNDVQEEDSVQALKRKVCGRFSGLNEHNIRLIFGGRQLEDGTVADYGVTKNSTLQVVARLHGGTYKRLKPADGLVLTTEPDMLKMDDAQGELRAKMSCGHAIGPNSITMYCRTAVESGHYRFTCPHIVPGVSRACGKVWPYPEVRKVGMLTQEERVYFETNTSSLYAHQELGAKECPKCSTTSERVNKLAPTVFCDVCKQTFCWTCLTAIKAKTAHKCAPPSSPFAYTALKEAPMKTINSRNVPSRRACPQCKTFIEHEGGCNEMDCQFCGTRFCFICLRLWKDHSGTCYIAPVQDGEDLTVKTSTLRHKIYRIL
ncbi:hypothetical protein HDV00_006555 [Rhizophlyctis rosea]|nr:hypothetical protein HDV00_006555 [Rhizophlyctis rosea]